MYSANCVECGTVFSNKFFNGRCITAGCPECGCLVCELPDERNAESVFTENADARKTFPMYSGLIKYFPDALALVCHISWKGNEQHHPGTPLHWDKSKSADEPDALLRHMTDYAKDGDIEELGKVAWRALAWLQRTLEAE